MPEKSFQVDYFKKPSDPNYPGNLPYPFFQLSVSGSFGGGGDPHEESSSNDYQVISTTQEFSTLALEILNYLKNPIALANRYKLNFSESASSFLKDKRIKVLEEIICLHNDFVTPKRS